MISKKKTVVICIILVVLTAVITFTSSNFISYKVGNKMLIPIEEYNMYKKTESDFKKAIELKNYIQENYYKPVDEEMMKVGILKGLFYGLEDPYSNYMTKEEFEELLIQTTGEYSGIGVTVVPASDGYITVIAPIEDTPAEKAGIKPGDRIIKVNDVEYTSAEMDQAISIMRGKPGTKVKVTILRKDNEIIDFDINRASIKLKTVKSEILDNNIGYIRITSFDDQTAKDFTNHLNKLQKSNIQGLVLDLRDNPGGLVDESVKIADQLIGKETVVYTEDRHGNRQYEESDKNRINLPYAILVNGGTASASEILSGAVKDTNSGVLIGTKTFGKGIIQRIIPLNEGDGIELTIAQYFSPKGNVIHGVGIEPNIIVELGEEELITKENDPQLNKAMEVLKKEINE